ncbi:hypothetical protein WA026_006688 [Henosepilachna vigintioctopunctata]|uniref:Uncharacterized protein n=1 Tax=Henosepilachna vigintioctopunctata TaxID=420089 RepID=A0AAW1UG23_9CUCU
MHGTTEPLTTEKLARNQIPRYKSQRDNVARRSLQYQNEEIGRPQAASRRWRHVLAACDSPADRGRRGRCTRATTAAAPNDDRCANFGIPGLPDAARAGPIRQPSGVGTKEVKDRREEGLYPWAGPRSWIFLERKISERFPRSKDNTRQFTSYSQQAALSTFTPAL